MGDAEGYKTVSIPWYETTNNRVEYTSEGAGEAAFALSLIKVLFFGVSGGRLPELYDGGAAAIGTPDEGAAASFGFFSFALFGTSTSSLFSILRFLFLSGRDESLGLEGVEEDGPLEVGAAGSIGTTGVADLETCGDEVGAVESPLASGAAASFFFFFGVARDETGAVPLMDGAEDRDPFVDTSSPGTGVDLPFFSGLGFLLPDLPAASAGNSMGEPVPDPDPLIFAIAALLDFLPERPRHFSK